MLRFVLFSLLLIAVRSAYIDWFFRPQLMTTQSVGNYTAISSSVNADYLVRKYFSHNKTMYSFLVMIKAVEINKDNFLAIGPIGPANNFDFCSLSTFQKSFNQSLDISDPKFCENNFCHNYTLSNRTLDEQLQIFYVNSFQFILQQCHVCVYGFNQSSFVENVKSGKCNKSNEVHKPWEKCGKIMEYDELTFVASYPVTFCYSLKDNTYFYQNDFSNRFFMLIYDQSQFIFVFVVNGFLCLLILIFMVIPEFDQILEIKKQIGFKSKIRFIFSLRNQIIFLSFISNFIASLSIFSMFTDNVAFFGFCIIVSVYFSFMQHFLIIMLWSFFINKSKKFELKTLSTLQV
jgi:hypothetical protein